MTKDDFLRYDAELLASANAVLDNRNAAYAPSDDYVGNFKTIAARTGLTPTQVWNVLDAKASNAITKLMNGEDAPGETPEERWSDRCNYVRLGYALWRERRDSNVLGSWGNDMPVERPRPVDWQRALGPATLAFCRVPACTDYGLRELDGFCFNHGPNGTTETKVRRFIG